MRESEREKEKKKEAGPPEATANGNASSLFNVK